jgi:hypothetical protein
MTVDDALSVIEELRKTKSDKEIIRAFFLMYKDNELSFDEFDALSKLVGYDLPEDFRQLSDKERKEFII